MFIPGLIGMVSEPPSQLSYSFSSRLELISRDGRCLEEPRAAHFNEGRFAEEIAPGIHGSQFLLVFRNVESSGMWSVLMKSTFRSIRVFQAAGVSGAFQNLIPLPIP